MKKEIGIVIKALRKHFGYKQEFLAQKINVTTETLANIENGRVGIDVEKMYRSSMVFNFSIDTIVKLAAEILEERRYDWLASALTFIRPSPLNFLAEEN